MLKQQHHSMFRHGSRVCVFYMNVYTSQAFDNVWHHVVMSWDGKCIRVYVDGFLRATKEFAGKQQRQCLSILYSDFKIVNGLQYRNLCPCILVIWGHTLHKGMHLLLLQTPQYAIEYSVHTVDINML